MFLEVWWAIYSLVPSFCLFMFALDPRLTTRLERLMWSWRLAKQYSDHDQLFYTLYVASCKQTIHLPQIEQKLVQLISRNGSPVGLIQVNWPPDSLDSPHAPENRYGGDPVPLSCE